MSVTKQQVSALYIAVYGRAPEASGLKFWSEEFTGSYADAAAAFVTHPLFAQEYAELSNQEIVEKFYTNILGAEGDTAGIEYWVERLENGEDMNVVLSEFLNISLTGDFTGDEAALARQATLVNKAEVAVYYAEKMGEASEFPEGTDLNSVDVANADAFKKAAEAIANVNASAASVEAAKAAIDAAAPVEPGTPGETYYLEADRDVISGTENDDTFIADIIQNQNGQQVNTLGSGDRLDGGEGIDTLIAEIAGSNHVSGASQQIQPKTTSVENIVLEGVQAFSEMDLALLNAKDMNGVEYIGSERSNADVVVNDLTTKDNNGNARDTADMTVGMKYTANGGEIFGASDFTVLFDQDYLTRLPKSKDGWSYEILNQKSWDANTLEPVKGFPLQRLTFDLERDGKVEKIVLNVTVDELKDVVTHQQLADLLNTKLADKDVAGLHFEVGSTFSDGDGRTSDRIDLVNNDGDQKIVKGAIGLDEESSAGNLFWDNKELEQVKSEVPVTINVELEKVGLAGDGGNLIIGSNNTEFENEWDSANTVAEGTVSGVEVFNVTVNGGKDKSSSLAGLHSTNNNLRVVNVVSADGGNANLTIGNSNTAGDWNHNGVVGQYAGALKDVQTFNASGFNGDLNLQAALTDEVTNKYLANGGTEVKFDYVGGAGNDSIDLAIDAANLASAGTATHGDFKLEVSGGAGNDTITVGLYDSNGQLANAGTGTALEAWYANQKTNANLQINGGEGNDTVNLLGSGDWNVNLGSGDDVIYVDNSGDKASWIYNLKAGSTAPTFGSEWEDAVGGGNLTHNLYKAGITLTLTDDVGGTYELNLFVESDKANGYQTSQKAINEAIKNAISNDSVFSKLLDATTGQMADTLIINALIDGNVQLDIIVDQLAAGATQTQIDDFNAKYGANINLAGLNNAYNSVINPNTPNATTATDALDTNSATEVGTASSSTVGYQIIEGGKGNDVLVLGTDAEQTHSLVYNEYSNGNDTILNFATGTDKVDLSSYDAKGLVLNSNNADTTALGAVAGVANGETFAVINHSDNGHYTVEMWTLNTSGDNVKLGTVGVLDFGDQNNFATGTDITW